MDDKHNEDFCNYYENLLANLEFDQQKEIMLVIQEMMNRSLSKFFKDFEEFLDFPVEIENFVIVPSIQKVESTFSTYRRVETIDNLSKQKLY